MGSSSPRRWYRFSLRAMFAGTTAVAVAIVVGPIGSLVLLYVAFFASLRFSSKRLPDVVQTMQGQRVSRQVYLTSMLFVGLWGPLFPTGLLLVGLAQELNVVRIVNYVAWAACALLLIVIAAHWRTVSINSQEVAQP